MTIYQDFLRHHSRSTDTVVAAVADNCRFDERAGVARWQQFDDLLSEVIAGADGIQWQDWAETDRLHLERYCHVASLNVPDAFLDINQDAWLDELSDNQSVVRIEALAQPLQISGMSLDNLNELLQQADKGAPDANRAVQDFFDTWNLRRDARPAFVAFYDEVKQEADDVDWPHALRDRLGLGHYGFAGGAPLAVALMRYSLAEVFSAHANRQGSAACAMPTVLDGGMHEFFFPVPREHPYGATVHLSPDLADTLTAELVHCRIDYQRKHLWRLGWIRDPRQLTHEQLRGARDLHLVASQEECGREHFGEFLEGRI